MQVSKILHFKPKIVKKISKCPLASSDLLEACGSFGISFSSADSVKALEIAKQVHALHKKLKIHAKEYIIVPYTSLLSQVPLYNSKIPICTIDNLLETLLDLGDRVVNESISCYNLTIYYHDAQKEIFLQVQDLHREVDY